MRGKGHFIIKGHYWDVKRRELKKGRDHEEGDGTCYMYQSLEGAERGGRVS